MKQQQQRGSWVYWQLVFAHWREQLPERESIPAAQFPLLVRNCDPVVGSEAEAAVSFLIQRGSWPEMSKAASMHLELRCRHAEWVCLVQEKTGEPESQATWSEIARWALLDCWRKTAKRWADKYAS